MMKLLAAQFGDRRSADRHHAGLGKDHSDLHQSSVSGQAALAVLLLQGRPSAMRYLRGPQRPSLWSW